MTQTLNRKKSFGTVYGHPQIGYEQDGLMFKHDGALHVPEPDKPRVTSVPTVDSLPGASQVGTAPEVLKAIEGLSSQIKDLKTEPKSPDPARSEAARRIWAERRAREAGATHEASVADPA
jgi:hypothetical protein